MVCGDKICLQTSFGILLWLVLDFRLNECRLRWWKSFAQWHRTPFFSYSKRYKKCVKWNDFVKEFYLVLTETLTINLDRYVLNYIVINYACWDFNELRNLCTKKYFNCIKKSAFNVTIRYNFRKHVFLNYSC